MSFFIRKRSKFSSKNNTKGKSKRPKGRRPGPLKSGENEEISEASDEEIPSDEENISEAESTDSELDRETAQEKRLRLTKQYLSQVEAEVDEAVQSDDEHIGVGDLVGKKLADEVRKQRGRHFISKANEILEPKDNDITILRGHQLALTCLVISPDDRYIFTGSKDCSIIKWDVAAKKKVAVVHGGRKNTDDTHKGHTSHILCLAISSDGKYLCSGDANKLIMVWDPHTMNLIHTFRGHKGPITGLAFRRDSHQLFSSSFDRSVKVWTLDEMGYIETLFGHQDAIQGLDAYIRERVVTCGGRDNTARVWKIVEESQLIFNSSGGSIDCICLIDEERFVTGSDTNQICTWHVSKKRPQGYLNNAHGSDGENWISSITCLKNTDLLASGSKDGNVKLWRLGRSDTVPSLLHSVSVPGFINDLKFSSEGQFLVAAVGQEHKLGRWWKIKNAKNCLAIIKLPRKEKRTFMLS